MSTRREEMANESRKTKGRVRFLTKDGAPVANATVNVKLTNHEFLFGCGGFDAINRTEDEPSEFFIDRMNKWTDLCNYGTMSFYWGQFEPEEGKPKTESRMRASKFLVEHGAKVKGHPLCWHTACANWLMEYDNKTILEKQLARINRDVSEFKGVIDMWDVINEVVIMPVFDRYDNAITRICKQYGQVNLVKEVFDAAKAANPDSVLLINDFNLSDKYAELIDKCLEAGVPISAIGLQTHQHQGYMGLAKLEEILKRFEKFGLPLHFTENTLVSGHIMPAHIVDLNDYQIPEWPSTPEGEERQAREMKEMYTYLFDHPLVEAITGWDFSDGKWLGAPSGVIRKDNSLKPSYEMLKHLIKEEWTTNATLKTDEAGYIEFDGYRGDYAATIDGRDVSFKLSKTGKDIECVI